MSVKEKFLAAVNVIESLPSDGKEILCLKLIWLAYLKEVNWDELAWNVISSIQ